MAESVTRNAQGTMSAPPQRAALAADGPPTNPRQAAAAKLRMGDRLVTEGLISADQLDVALKEQKAGGKMLGEVLVDLGFITENTLAGQLAESSGLDQFDMKLSVLDVHTVRRIPREIAERQKIMAVAIDDEREMVQVAMADVYNVLAIDQVRRHFPRGYEIVPLVASETELMEAIDSYYGYEMSIDGLLREIEEGDVSVTTITTGAEGFVNPTVRLVNAIILDAIKIGASDLHFEPENMFVRLRYRLDGVMTQIRTFHKDYWPSICVRLKIMSDMNIAENRNPQDGRFSFQVGAREVDFRVATHPTIHGENIVIRVLDKAKSLVALEKLGYDPDTVDLLKKLLLRPEGIIIVTGPTGSGKTTTLYSILNYLNAIDVNIMTLEEPVEYQIPLLRQSDVRDSGGMGFAEGVRSILRQDPDIVFVGEVRDEATSSMALRAAMTGHQVFTTLHTNDSFGAINRLTDLGLPRHMLAGNIILVMAQRLLRKLCTHCRKPVAADAQARKIIGLPEDGEPVTIYEPVGCEHCRNTGYKGRTAIVEILPFDRQLDEIVALGGTRGQMLEHVRQFGFRTMAENGAMKVQRGETSVRELIDTVDLTDRL